MEETKKRQTAYKSRIAELLNAPYVKEGGWNPSYVTINGLHVSRVSVVAAVISTGEETIIDDGSGKIPIRSFDFVPDVNTGDIVLIIGKIREFGSQKYIAPEVIKKVDAAFAKLRQLELEKEALIQPKTVVAEQNAPQETAIKEDQPEEDLFEEEIVKAESVEGLNGTRKKVYELIKTLDSGDGADMDKVMASAGESSAEQDIEYLMKRGEIFEVRPGKLKVLE